MSTVLERFSSKVAKSDGCWEWTGAKSYGGYGRFSFNGRNCNAHRVAYQLAFGPIPTGKGWHGLCVLHRCDNRLCQRPDHLFLGSQEENISDMTQKGRLVKPYRGKTHCCNGHEFTAENTYRWKGDQRKCRECNRVRCRERYARRKVA